MSSFGKKCLFVVGGFLAIIIFFALCSRVCPRDAKANSIAVKTLAGLSGLSMAGGVPIVDELANARDFHFDLEFHDESLDPRNIEYEDILSGIHNDIKLAVERIKLDHNAGQWRAVAETIRQLGLDGKDRAELVENVLRYPLTMTLPPSVAITREALANWQTARRIFMRWLPQLSEIQ